MPKLRNPFRRTYSPNQIVALNVGRARALRGWTQEQAAEALAPYLGTKWSNASFSAVERSIAGTRVKQFSADELVALSRGFDLPLGWFFTPPPPSEDAGVAVPDAGMLNGTDPKLLLDVVLGTDDNREPWHRALLDYASETAAREGTTRNAPPPSGKVDTGIDGLAELRAAAELRQAFGDVAEARNVLLRFADLLARLDQPDAPARADTNRSRRRRTT
ncbi:MAG: helix-turn-helix transcriptional regulator [Acidimicrobiales bacterium]|jgi:transcriptional regulator with XRE-family HTH domain|nr:helix-turn-helix transcriptional regulator [Acidimicrobiales bacterium]